MANKGERLVLVTDSGVEVYLGERWESLEEWLQHALVVAVLPEAICPAALPEEVEA